MGLEFDSFINKPMDLCEKTDKNTVNLFVENMVKINELVRGPKHGCSQVG